ncbi:MAG: hypothetical protein GY826_27555 [Fuerstiella sp.]|nr:hypothetical protein [Fuerstiella sp.]
MNTTCTNRFRSPRPSAACWHVAAPYAAAQVTIRCLPGDGVEHAFALFGGTVLRVSAELPYRQLAGQSVKRKTLFRLAGIMLWVVMNLYNWQ